MLFPSVGGYMLKNTELKNVKKHQIYILKKNFFRLFLWELKAIVL